MSLMPTTYKILSSNLLSRFTAYAEEIIAVISVHIGATG